MKILLTSILVVAIVGVIIIVYSQSKNINEEKYLSDNLFCQYDTDCVKQFDDCTCTSVYSTVNKYHYKKLDCGTLKAPGEAVTCMGFTVGEPKCQNNQCILVTKK